MTVTLHPRETGATVRCDYHGCHRQLTTGQILIKPIRAYARSLGWIRGLDPGSGGPDNENGRPSNTQCDICPTHAVEERRKCDERNTAKNARRARRDALARMTFAEKLADQRRVRNASAKARRKRRKESAAAIASMITAVSA